MDRKLWIAGVVIALLVFGGLGAALTRQPSERGLPATQPTAGEPSADQMQQLQDQQQRQSQAGEPGTY